METPCACAHTHAHDGANVPLVQRTGVRTAPVQAHGPCARPAAPLMRAQCPRAQTQRPVQTLATCARSHARTPGSRSGSSGGRRQLRGAGQQHPRVQEQLLGVRRPRRRAPMNNAWLQARALPRRRAGQGQNTKREPRRAGSPGDTGTQGHTRGHGDTPLRPSSVPQFPHPPLLAAGMAPAALGSRFGAALSITSGPHGALVIQGGQGLSRPLFGWVLQILAGTPPPSLPPQGQRGHRVSASRCPPPRGDPSCSTASAWGLADSFKGILCFLSHINASGGGFGVAPDVPQRCLVRGRCPWRPGVPPAARSGPALTVSPCPGQCQSHPQH